MKTYIITISYRARDNQSFRREQIIKTLENIKEYFSQNNLKYIIIICEQNDNKQFNRGALLNACFIEGERLLIQNKIYIQIDADYLFNTQHEFPKDILNFETGFIDLYKFIDYDTIGACVFDSISYIKTNGYPNDLYGWGGDDWALCKRIHEKECEYKIFGYRTKNPPLIIEQTSPDKKLYFDETNNVLNIKLSKRNDTDLNGVRQCKYKIIKCGEFFNNKDIIHLLIEFI